MTQTRTKIVEAYALFNRALGGDLRAKADVAESLTTSDFPILLGRGFQTKIDAAYQTATPVWQQYSKRVTVPNFRPQAAASVLGGFGALERVAEATEYPAGTLDETLVEFSVEKYGKRLPLTWEMLVNDELGAFRSIDQVIATAAVDTESAVTAGAFLNPAKSDVNTAFFKTGNGNAPQSVDLNEKSLQDALTALGTRKDSDGRIIARPNLVLVVPPALEFLAHALVQSQTITRDIEGIKYESGNPLAGSVSVVVEPRLAENANSKAAGTWFLLAAPQSVRPSMVTAFLAGHEGPDLRVKADAGNRPGGGAIDPREGSFDDDTIQYRARHVVGAALVDPMFTFVSRGA